jgi:hypothetical protein
VFVWIGEFDRSRKISGNVRAVYHHQFKARHLANLSAFVATMKLHELALQLIALRTKIRGTRLPRSIAFTITPKRGTWDDYMPELWPDVPELVEWPFAATLGGDDKLDFLAHRLSGLLA